MGQSSNTTSFERCLDSANRRIGKVKAALEATQAFLRLNNMESAYIAAFEAANHSEKLTMLTRALPAYTGHPYAKEMMDIALLNAFPVDIGFTAEGWFCIRLPALLPKKNKGSADYITGALYTAMTRFWENKPTVRYPCNVTVFRHVYKMERPERQYRDHDNIELNRVLDIVALYVMPDDSPLHSEHFYCSAAGNSERTEVYVIPKDNFADWLVLRKTIPEEGVKLYEDHP